MCSAWRTASRPHDRALPPPHTPFQCGPCYSSQRANHPGAWCPSECALGHDRNLQDTRCRAVHAGGAVAFAVTASSSETAGMRVRRPRPAPIARSAFAGFRFPPDVIVLAVRWYLRFGLSHRDVEELLTERGVEVDHVTVYRWVLQFTPLLAEAARPCRHRVGARWWVDETYVKVAGHCGMSIVRLTSPARSSTCLSQRNGMPTRPGAALL